MCYCVHRKDKQSERETEKAKQWRQRGGRVDHACALSQLQRHSSSKQKQQHRRGGEKEKDRRESLREDCSLRQRNKSCREQLSISAKKNNGGILQGGGGGHDSSETVTEQRRHTVISAD